MILSDRDIRALCKPPCWPVAVNTGDVWLPEKHSMIHPFSEGVQTGEVISYGLSHAGYDLRLGDTLLVFKNTWNMTIDPKLFRSQEYRDKVFDKVTPSIAAPGKNGHYIIPPHSYALGVSFEYLRIPRHLKGRCVGKSTMARCGLLINTTPAEPGWEGHLTIEISNISPCPAIVYANEGIAQMEFETLTAEPEVDYAQKAGKYNKQGYEPVPARVKE